jgi:hypothetical protein
MSQQEMNVHVSFRESGRQIEVHRKVKMSLENAWIALEDEYGDVVVYSRDVVDKVTAKPTSYGRRN